MAGSQGGHQPVSRRGQALVAQRCSDFDARYLHGEVLVTAAARGRVDIMKDFLDYIADINLEELTKTLESVCAWGSEETLIRVLDHDNRKLLGIQQYSSGLDQAARKNNHPLVVYWLKKHPEHQHMVVDPAAVIDVAGNGFINILPLLIEYMRPEESSQKTLGQCLQVASGNGHQEVVRYLIAGNTDINAAVEEVRYTSGGGRSLDSPKQYGYNYTDKSRRKRTALDSPKQYGYNDTDKSRRKRTALQAALVGFERFCPLTDKKYSVGRARSSWRAADALSQERCIEILLAKGADPNGTSEYKRYPLEIAAACCTVEVVRKVINSGARVEAMMIDPALRAAASRETDGSPIVEALLEASDSTSLTDSSVAAALDKALSFFDTSCSGGRFETSTRIAAILSTGFGAVIKILLARLPNKKADNRRFGVLLLFACVLGDQECVELLLQHGIDVNGRGNYYRTALQAASRTGNIEIVTRLIQSGADVNIIDGEHGTALRAAVLGGQGGIVSHLIACGADGKSVLHIAVESRSRSIFQTLLTAGAEVDTNISHQNDALTTACERGDFIFAELLLASGFSVNVPGNQREYDLYMANGRTTPLHAACAAGDLSVIRLLLEHGANIETTGESSTTPLHAACAAGDLSVIRLLLEHGADIETTGESSTTPLLVAIRSRHLSVVKLLLEAHVNVNHSVDGTPLLEAAKHGELKIVEELLDAGAIIGDPSATANALASACRNRHHMVVELLLEALSGSPHEAEICSEALSQTMNRSSPDMICLLLERIASPSFGLLRQVCSAGVLEAVKMMVNSGIDVNEDDGVDAPLLHVAASQSRPDVVQFLLERGADVALRSAEYGSAITAALEGTMARFLRTSFPLPKFIDYSYIFNGSRNRLKSRYHDLIRCEQIVHSLLEAGVEIDTTLGKFGNALHLASYLGSPTIVHELQERIEDINIFGGYFGSPLIAAARGDHPVIVELLLDRAIEVNKSSSVHGSAMHCACKLGSKRMIRCLLNHGASINANDGDKGSFLAAALSCRKNPSTEETMIRQLEKSHEIFGILLRHEPKVRVTEYDLLTALSMEFEDDRLKFTSLFLRHDESAIATETVIVNAIRKASTSSNNSEILALLLKRDAGLGTTPAMLKAARDGYMLRLLLEHTPQCRLTADVVINMMKDWRKWHSPEMMNVLFEYGMTVEFATEVIDVLKKDSRGTTISKREFSSIISEDETDSVFSEDETDSVFSEDKTDNAFSEDDMS